MSYLVEQFAKECAEECAEETRAIDLTEYVENCAESLGISLEKACAVLKLTLADYENAKKKLAEIAAEEAEDEAWEKAREKAKEETEEI